MSDGSGARPAIIQVALPAPLMRTFDYRPPETHVPLQAGQRVRVPFGRTRKVGVIMGTADHTSVPPKKLRAAEALLDEQPLLDQSLRELLAWAAHYYHYPLGEVIAAALPAQLRKGSELPCAAERWRITAAGLSVEISALAKRARVQAAIMDVAHAHRQGFGREQLADLSGSWRKSLSPLIEQGWLESIPGSLWPSSAENHPLPGPSLNTHQRAAVEAIHGTKGYAAFLLDGVTGSGKTEVYLACIKEQLAAGRQSLVLVPEIGLTPQLVMRFRERLGLEVAVLHSGLSDGDRLLAWAAAADGSAQVILGTRSAVFTPLARPGLLIVDEEHDPSLKQQDGFRYSARDLAVSRAARLRVPIVLGSATPAFESLDNVAGSRYTRLELPHRPGASKPPSFRLLDISRQPTREGLSPALEESIGQHLADDGQVLVYLNRRGYAPVLMCAGCGEVAECTRCDARMVVHRSQGYLACHHCGAQRAIPENCEHCGDVLRPIGQGTERLETYLRERFPEQTLVRIDRDTTRRRGEIERRLETVRSGEARLLLGTQMLTKGHDFPNVTLVAIVDADQGLFGTDFRASERLAQTILQVAGRAGRAERPGEVLIQTLYPQHPLLQALTTEGYAAFAQTALAERRDSGWPPAGYLALLRAESTDREAVFRFLQQANEAAEPLAGPGVLRLGPAPAPMEKRQGRYRGQLLIRAGKRGELQNFLGPWRGLLEGLPAARQARWSLDIDPVELF